MEAFAVSLAGRRRKPALATAAVLLALAALLMSGCGGSGAGEQIDVVGYSTPQEAYESYLEPGFQSVGTGADVGFDNSFGESPAQRRALEDGQPAAIVQLANAGEMEDLVKAGIVAPGWDLEPFHGIMQRSLVVLLVRRGNPLHIGSFEDLQNRSIGVIFPNPLTSNTGPWAVAAIYGSALREGKSEAEALSATEQLLRNAVAQPDTDREVLEKFEQGEGDAVLLYESEALEAVKQDKAIQYVIPPSTIYVESPIAATSEAPAASQSFLDYMWSTAGQELWVKKSFRPVKTYVLSPVQFPKPEGLFKIDAIGGWQKIDRELLDPETGKIAKLERKLGMASED